MPACDDISGGLERTPVSFLNDLDGEDLPYFEYTTANVPGPGSDEQAFSEALCSCDCEAACDARCPCLARSSRARVPGTRHPGCVGFSPVECSPLCSCDATCPNRHVQRGLRHRLQVFKTRAKGFGVRALERIPCGSYVCSYAGEVIGLDVARKRVARLDPDRDSNYVMVLREGGVTTLAVDPSGVGGVGRFLNHSCEPNLAMTPVRTECAVPELALFAVRDIGAGEELTYDYSDGSSTKAGVKPCSCGSARCCGWLPFDADVLGV
ncbi:hypothetical protein HPB48_010452 [Haemaphysalis longicornis]|uniref:Histone-lysine N-methyltransferase SETMAR n=1 Tax=Haemaphysalis longicornis TaxID=44386 RepID=A0A9J6H348_HAELO|nr:hypothetical protein HPB48_010452 [Haemaphysalis longicornis]